MAYDRQFVEWCAAAGLLEQERLIGRTFVFQGYRGPVENGDVWIVACTCVAIEFWVGNLTLRATAGDIRYTFLWDVKDKTWRQEKGVWRGTITFPSIL